MSQLITLMDGVEYLFLTLMAMDCSLVLFVIVHDLFSTNKFVRS